MPTPPDASRGGPGAFPRRSYRFRGGRSVGHLLACAFRLARQFLFRHLPLRTRVALDYRRIFRRPLSFSHPQTFNEKLNLLKISPDAERLAPYADKIAVRDYVAATLGPDVLIPLLGTWRTPAEIDFASLPPSFVLKCNHGSGQNLVVRDKSTLDLPATRRLLRSWLRENHYRISAERIYRPSPPIYAYDTDV